MFLDLPIAESKVQSIPAFSDRNAGDTRALATVIKRRPQVKGCPHAYATWRLS